VVVKMVMYVLILQDLLDEDVPNLPEEGVYLV